MAARLKKTALPTANVAKTKSATPPARHRGISADEATKRLLKHAGESANTPYTSPALCRTLGGYLSLLSARPRPKVALITARPAATEGVPGLVHLIAAALPHARFSLASPDSGHTSALPLCTLTAVIPGDQHALTGWADAEGPFDLVIDDGSMKGPQSLATLFVMFHQLREGGFYLLDEVQTSYWPQFGGSSLAPDLFDTPMRWVKLFCDIVQRADFLNTDNIATRTGFEIASVHVHPRQCYIERGPVPQGLNEKTRQHWLGLERIKAKDLEALCRRLALDNEFRLQAHQLVDLLQKLGPSSV